MAELTGTTPKFGGSTGGLLTKAEVEGKYAITWSSGEEQVFEMPTGGAATMVSGDNLLYLARKEQCLALGTQLRTKFKIDYQVYSVTPEGESTLVHPADGVYPEKVNEGREAVGSRYHSISGNPEPSLVKFSGQASYEA